MRYFEISPLACPSMRLPHTHAVLLPISIETDLWHRFEQMADDNRDVHLIWHGPASGGRKEALVACTSQEVAERLENGWT